MKIVYIICTTYKMEKIACLKFISITTTPFSRTLTFYFTPQVFGGLCLEVFRPTVCSICHICHLCLQSLLTLNLKSPLGIADDAYCENSKILTNVTVTTFALQTTEPSESLYLRRSCLPSSQLGRCYVMCR